MMGKLWIWPNKIEPYQPKDLFFQQMMEDEPCRWKPGMEVTDEEVIRTIRLVPRHYAFLNFYIQTTGNNSNSGTDTSDTAKYTSINGAWTASPAFTFVPTDGSNPVSGGVAVNDWCNIGGGFVVQVTGVVNAANGTITFANAGTVFYGTALATSTKSLFDGGAFSSLAVVTGTTPLAVTGTGTGATKVNVKVGTYANTSTARTFAMAGATTAPVWWSGYKTTPGDMDTSSTTARVAGTDIPSITFTTGQCVLSGAHQKFSSIDVTGACVTAGGQVKVTSTSCELWRVRATCTAANANSVACSLGGNTAAVGCYFQASSSANVVTSASGDVFVAGCVISGGAIGISVTAGRATITKNTFLSNGSHCIQTTAASVFVITHNSAYGTQVGDFYNISTTQVTMAFVTDNVGWGLVNGINNNLGTNTNLVHRNNNSFGNLSGSAEVGFGDSPAFDSQTEAALPFGGAINLQLLPTAAAYQKYAPGLYEGPAASTTTKGFNSAGAAEPNAGPIGQITGARSIGTY